jgi:ankyrin repeat protein
MFIKNRFTSFPIEVLLKIFSYLSPETVATAALVNKNFEAIAKANLFWQEKFRCHFEAVFNTLKIERNFNWYDAFVKTYHDEYENLSPTARKFFSLVKEGDIKGLIALLKLENTKSKLNNVELLISLLTNSNICDKNKQSLLQWARKKSRQAQGKTQVMFDNFYALIGQEFFTDFPINPGKTDPFGKTILHWAICCYQPLETINLLIKQGANVNAATLDTKLTPLCIAVCNGDLAIVETLLTNDADRRSDVQGLTPLHYAALRGSPEIIEILLRNGTDINETSADGLTPLHRAAIEGHLKAVETLLERGADINKISADGLTPLRFAVINRHVEVVKAFLAKDHHINQNNLSVLESLCREGNQIMLDYIYQLITKEYFTADLPINKKKIDAIQKTILHWAILCHQPMATITLLIEQGADINAISPDGMTPLYIAALTGYLQAVELLLAKNANSNIACFDGTTPLFAAARCGGGALEIVKLLLVEGVNIPYSNNGRTPLFTAAQYGQLEVIELLVSNDATSLTDADNYGVTPLIAAANNGHSKVVALLLAKGANLTCADHEGRTPLFAAATEGHFEVVKLLLEKDAMITYTNDNMTAVHAAIINRHLEVAKLLIIQAGNIHAIINGLNPLLALAADEGDMELIEILLTAGANIDAPNIDGRTPLHYAAFHGSKEIIKILLAAGANIDATDINGVTPLYLATFYKHKEIVDALLAARANPNIPCNDGKTPLHRAVYTGSKEIVEALLAARANPNIPCNDGKTPLHTAVYNGSKEIAGMLLAAGANINVSCNYYGTSLNIAALHGDLETMKVLLANGATIIPNNRNFTPLHLAAQAGHCEAVKLLLVAGGIGEIDATTSDGATSLLLSITKENLQMVKLLLEKGAAVNAIAINPMNGTGRTPLLVAVYLGHLEVVKVLLAAEADPNLGCTGINGTSLIPLCIAAEKGDLEMVKLLLANGAKLELAHTTDGKTPLSIATQRGYAHVVKYINDYLTASANETDDCRITTSLKT